MCPPRSGRQGRSGAPAAGSQGFQELKAEAERQIVVAALERNDWHVTRTAQALGLADHASLLKIMRRHGIRTAGMRGGVAGPFSRPARSRATTCSTWTHGAITDSVSTGTRPVEFVAPAHQS